ncbi:MAG: DUF1289 domain-containing protein [Gammaproteobacteria bacterium]
MSHSASDRSSPPGSPCINVCVLATAGYCVGCLRTGDEIARWRQMSGPEQWRLIDALAERRARLAPSPPPPPDGDSDES